MNHETYTPGTDKSFDRVFSHALIDILSDPIRAAKEMFRVLKPGDSVSAVTLREWSQSDDCLFAQCWGSCVAQNPHNQEGDCL